LWVYINEVRRDVNSRRSKFAGTAVACAHDFDAWYMRVWVIYNLKKS